MVHAINTKLLLVMVGLLTTIAGYMAYQHHSIVLRDEREAAQRKEVQDFYRKVDEQPVYKFTFDPKVLQDFRVGTQTKASEAGRK